MNKITWSRLVGGATKYRPHVISGLSLRSINLTRGKGVERKRTLVELDEQSQALAGSRALGALAANVFKSVLSSSGPIDKRQKTKLGPEIGFVMAPPTTHHATFFEL